MHPEPGEQHKLQTYVHVKICVRGKKCVRISDVEPVILCDYNSNTMEESLALAFISCLLHRNHGQWVHRQLLRVPTCIISAFEDVRPSKTYTSDSAYVPNI